MPPDQTEGTDLPPLIDSLLMLVQPIELVKADEFQLVSRNTETLAIERILAITILL